MKAWVRRQRICVTGGNGVLGQRLVIRLLKYGARKLVVFDLRKPSAGAKSSSVRYVNGSILKQSELDTALRGCTIVFHLAGLTHAGDSDEEPKRYWDVNCTGTVNVLEACRKSGISRIVYTSTGHVYGIPRRLPVHEDHTTRPLSIYASSKLAGEEAVQGYVAGYGLGGIIARLSNLYGPGFGTNTVVGLALDQAARGGPMVMRNPEAVRDFTHLDDAVEALLRLAAIETSPAECRIINVSHGRGVSVANIVQTLRKIAKRQGIVLHLGHVVPDSTPEKIPSFFLSNCLLRESTGWVPSIDLERGLTMALQERQAQGTRGE